MKGYKIFFKKNENLIFGPYLGEFGWELMSFQGYIRKIRKKYKYKRIVVVSYKSSEYLYEGCEFYPHNFNLEKSGFGLGEYDEDMIKNYLSEVAQKLNFKKYDIFTPLHINRLNKLLLGKQVFKKFYESSILNETLDIVFHFRTIVKKDGNKKNYDIESIKFISEYCINKGLKIGFIGLPAYSFSLGEEFDYRSEDLRFTISIISNSRLVVGGSSAPMHLAALCGKPIVTWIGKEADIERYYSYWNPFKVPVFVVSDSNWRPPKEDVVQKIDEAFQKLIR